jgi:UDP-glucose 4-epimerase
MKILVTGGAGFIGSNLVDFLLKSGHKVVVIDDFTTGKRENLSSCIKNIEVIEARVEGYDLTLLKDINAVVHLAAQASVPLSISKFKKSSTTNLFSSLNIFDYCTQNKLPLVYASSSAIYGEMEIGDDEDVAVDLMTPYAVDKYAMELYSKVLWKLNGLSSIGLRFFNVYGPRQDPSSPYSGVISIFTDRILKHKEVVINGGNQTRDFVYIDDVIRAIYKSLILCKDQCVSHNINILTGIESSIIELFTTIANEINIPTTKLLKPMLAGDPFKSNGTTTKMHELLGLKGKSFISLDEGLRITIKSMSNPNE